jgi:hypothetical protein
VGARFAELYANAPGWFELRPLHEAEWMLGSDSHWLEQRSTKWLTIILQLLGFDVIVCREGAPSDIILNGTVRVELKSGTVSGEMDFKQPKQKRMFPTDGSPRLLDLVIQSQFNKDDNALWSRFVVIPFSALVEKKTRSDSTIRSEVCTKYELFANPKDAAKMHKFYSELRRRVYESADPDALPNHAMRTPNAPLLKLPEYLAAWLNIDLDCLSARMPDLVQLEELMGHIRANEPGEDKRPSIPGNWPAGVK